MKKIKIKTAFICLCFGLYPFVYLSLSIIIIIVIIYLYFPWFQKVLFLLRSQVYKADSERPFSSFVVLHGLEILGWDESIDARIKSFGDKAESLVAA